MKKQLLLAMAFVAGVFTANAQTYQLDIEGLYQTCLTEAAAGGPATVDGTKALVNADRTDGIFTLVSPSNRTFRVDVDDVTWEDETVTTSRLETNGASNTTNGRKIYIDCPKDGILYIGAYTGTDGRGYTIEKEDGTVLFTESLVKDDKGKIFQYPIASAGKIVINPNAGYYYGIVKYVVENGSSTGISSSVSSATVVSTEYFNVVGVKQNEPAKGLNIVKKTMDNGTVVVEKEYIK